MAWTQTELDIIKAAYASGAIEVRFSDRLTKFRSLDEMERIIARMENELNAANGNQPIRQYRIYAKDGF